MSSTSVLTAQARAQSVGAHDRLFYSTMAVVIFSALKFL